jgi:hypothetical protein
MDPLLFASELVNALCNVAFFVLLISERILTGTRINLIGFIEQRLATFQLPTPHSMA